MIRTTLPLLLLLCTAAVTPSLCTPCPPKQWLARTTAVTPATAASATVSSLLNRSPRAQRALLSVARHFTNLALLLQTHDARRGDSWLCHDFHGYAHIQNALESRGWQKMSGNCTHGIRPDTRLANASDARSVFTTLRAFNDATAPLGASAARGYGVGWRAVLPAGVLPFQPEDEYRTCSLARVLAFRFEGRWGADAVFTNASVGADVADRGILHEVVTLNGRNRAESVGVRKPVCAGRNKTEFSRFQSGPALVQRASGPISPWFFQYQKLLKRGALFRIQSHPAVVHALRAGDFEKEMVEASGSFSNLAILVLPVALALLPIALFQDATMLMTVMYAIATDVVSVMPIAIKGVELIMYGSNLHYKASHFLNGVSAGSPTAVAQSWAVECGMKPFVRRKGMVLLACAVAAMVFGIVLEFVARGCVRRRRKGGRQWRDTVWMEHEAFLRQVPEKSGGKLRRSSSVDYSYNQFSFRDEGKKLGFLRR